MDVGAVSGGIGASVVRREDARLVCGAGTYTDDISLPGQAYAVMVRSPHAHAAICSIDTTAALALPGVLAVLTGADLVADGLKPLPNAPWSAHPVDIRLPNTDGSPHFGAPVCPLPRDRARYVGEGVAMVVAETLAQARDAADAVRVDYGPLAAGTRVDGANAVTLWDDLPSNVSVDAHAGDRAATEAAFARAAHVVRLATQVQRVTGVPMEPRAALASHDAASGRYTLYAGAGGTARLKAALAHALGVKAEQVRVVIREVGGNFGTRGGCYPEHVLLAWAAKRVGRPVKWLGDRQECFLSDYQGRDLAVEAELALDAEGKFLAMRGASMLNAGAYTLSYVSLQKSTEIISGIYDVPAAHWHARAVLTNTVPTHPYRATGRPEAMFVVERLIDLAATQCGFDRIALRRRNLVPKEAMPYTNAFGVTFDSGHYHASLEAALALGDWVNFPARRAQAEKRGRLRGIGTGTYVETATGFTREKTEMLVRPEGAIDVVIGTMSNGQGHETVFGQLLTEWLGVPSGCIRLIQGDSDVVSIGAGSHSGRSMRMASFVMHKASEKILARGREIAAHVLEAGVADIAFERGAFRVVGTDRSVGLFEVAAAALDHPAVPEDLRGPLGADSDETVNFGSFPYGAHVCEVEIDPETGVVDIVSYAAVDDVGRAVNPMLIDGQTHGGIAQGVGQALWEQCAYDPASGQLLSASFMDYTIARASRLPAFRTQITEVPATTHPFGIRAGSEGGTAPALGVVMNAVVDALSSRGVTHLEMPATPERVWRALRAKPHAPR